MILLPTRHKIDHFGDVLPSQSLGLLLKKLNPTHNGKQHKDKMAKTYRKPNLNPKPIVNCQNCSCVCISLSTMQYTTQHRTVLTIFPLIFPTLITAQMSSTAGKGTAIHINCLLLSILNKYIQHYDSFNNTTLK